MQQEPREFPPYQRGPPLSYMERMAEKRKLEEVSVNNVEFWWCCLGLTPPPPKKKKNKKNKKTKTK